MNNLVTSRGLREAVKASYCLSVCTGQSSELCGKEGKKNSVSGFPCLDYFARAAGRNTIPSGLNLLWSSCKAAKSAE